MADESRTVTNTTAGLSVNSDYDVAVDTVAGKDYQRFKLDAGADGAVLPVVAGQQTAANSLPVVLASDQTVTLANSPVRAEGSVSANGDYGIAPLGVVNTAGTSLQASGYSALATTVTGALQVHLDYNHAASQANNIMKLEDAAHATGDAGVFALAIHQSNSPSAVISNPLDYSGIAVNQYGAPYSDIHVNFQGNGTPANSPVRQEDVASAGADALMVVGAVRRDTPSTTTTLDGDYTNLTTDSSNRLWVNGSGVTQPVSAASLPLPSGAATEAKQDTIITHVDGIEGALTTLNAKDFATQTTLAALNTKIDTVADNAGFTDGTTKVLPAGYVFDEVAGTALTENDAAAARIDSKRAQVFTLEDGTTRGNRASVEVPGSYNVGIVYTNKGLSVNGRSHQIWDPSHPDNATADSGSPAGDGNWYGQNQESNGNLCTNISSIRGELLRYRNQTGVVQSGTNPPPLWIGGAAATVTPSSVTASRAVDGYWSKSGHLVVNLDSVREQDGDQLSTFTSTTSVATIVAADATYMNDLVGLIITNTSATATDVIIYDDDGTTARAHIYAPAGDTRGVVFAKPFKQTAINKLWKAKTVTSVASVYITAQFSKQL